MRATHLTCLLVSILLPACQTTRTGRPWVAPAQASSLAPMRAWEVRDGDLLAGFVVLFRGPDAPWSELYSVRNAWHQELGLVDRLGRAWRYRPHASEPEWIGTGTVVDGARAILGRPGGSLCAAALAEARQQRPNESRSSFAEKDLGASTGPAPPGLTHAPKQVQDARGEGPGFASIAARLDLERGFGTVPPQDRHSDSPQRECQP